MTAAAQVHLLAGVKPSPSVPRLNRRPSGSIFMKTACFPVVLLSLCAGVKLFADCTLTSVGLTPLPDLGWRMYKTNFVGGLYPGGANSRPAAHEAAGLQIASEQIQPLDTNGVPASNGSIVVISSGMSNTTQEWASKGTNHFKAQFSRDRSGNPRVSVIDGAIGG